MDANDVGDADDRARIALDAAKAGGSIAHERFRSELRVETKGGKTDYVTQVDRDAQRAATAVLEDAFPGEVVVGEEDEEETAVPESGPAWIIDPIDGTNNFVRGVRVFGTAVAAVVDGEAIAAASVFPALGDVYRVGPEGAYRNEESISVSDRTDPETAAVCPTIWWAYDERERYAAACREIVTRFGDLRRFGCAQAVLAMVADGQLDGTITDVVTNPWDTVAGVALVRAAGGTVTDLEGEPWRHDSVGLVASNGEIHDEVLAAARGIESS